MIVVHHRREEKTGPEISTHLKEVADKQTSVEMLRENSASQI
jgi:hypothetical protein